ncbi:stearoyl-CoA desaturase (delta-9 desaturase) [Amycolatopsis lexingtonensis]|uniref:Stearoyl-CoA desaturase (Delta-9 desaturase) n=1 Tax=Amycolatopsis lexingtonensis TaxID=218822 RepID=A0ABR9I0J3_9PSEU|nr:acyl-CoA desaturase [Amycolatopsis lexingtonensis]MBE1496714.1 stearoyl-CoA desaturase (delta-9 desaturase) [Amycolatopsis lexingtonensis]
MTSRAAPKPLISHRRGTGEMIVLKTFLLVPFAALLIAIPLVWGWGMTWLDLILAAVFYVFATLGVTVGYHRYFTHGAFKASRPLRVALAIAGSMAVQGSVIFWVASHRRHHAFADREGDPHSPWLFGTSPAALLRGFWHAHMGWMFGREVTNADRFAPDLVADDDLRWVNRYFWLWITLSLALPAVLGGLLSWSWWGFVTAFFWAGLVRIAFLHHVSWSVNSVCHLIGERPFASRDKAANFWPLAVLSMGESWHNSHHADPTCARHGVLRGQVDISARVIRTFEQLGWATDVRWPRADRLAAKRA